MQLIEISGTPYEMGLELGKKARKYIRAGAVFYRKNWRAITKVSWRESLQCLATSKKIAEKSIPKTIEEMRGMAKGSGVPLETLFAINSMETLSRFEKCTSVISRVHRRVLLAHNEDWILEDRKWIYLVRARPSGEPKFLAVTYGAWIPQYWLNETGLAMVSDSNTATDAQDGISGTLLGREAARCRTLASATRRLITLSRADGHTFNFATPNSGLIFETTATKYALLKPTKNLYRDFSSVHTNFYQSSKLQRYERDRRTYSKFRYERVKELFANSRELEIGLLADHKKFPKSVCNHTASAGNKKTGDQTIASFLIDPTKRSISIIAGNPCRGKPQTFNL